MRSLLNFLIRYHNLILFLILEGIAFYYLATGNNYHRTRVLNGVNTLVLRAEDKINSTRTYLSLREINAMLAAENVELRNRIQKLTIKESQLFFSVTDTLYNQQYQYTFAKVLNNSLNRQNNFFTIDKGLKEGLHTDMAVTSQNSVAGIIVKCSENFSVAMSVLNLNFRLSSRIKRNGYFGSLNWDGRDPQYAVLNEIPQHVPVSLGDTIETTGYSALFPEGVLVGTISDYEKKGGDFYKITVLLATDFRKLQYVDIISNLKKTEQLHLEKPFQ
jgi:rod shape-determining protein MreC